MNFLANFVLVALVFLEALRLQRVSATAGDSPNAVTQFADPGLTATSSKNDSSTSENPLPATCNLATRSSSSPDFSSTASAEKKVGIFPNHGVSQVTYSVSGVVTQTVSRVFSYTKDERQFLAKIIQETNRSSTVIHDNEYDNVFRRYEEALQRNQYVEVQPIVFSEEPMDYNSHSTLQVEQRSTSLTGTVDSISQVAITCQEEDVVIPKLPVIVQVGRNISGVVKQIALVIVACERYCWQPISVTQVCNAITGILTQDVKLYYDCPEGVVPSLDIYQDATSTSGHSNFNVSVFVNYKEKKQTSS